MTAKTYDVVIIGGGLAGAALAKSLAERGARVQVLERETAFKDRVRGEQMQPWGVAEARALGVYELLRETCGHEQPRVDMYLGAELFVHRDLTKTTPQAAPHFNFHHPRMQETLLAAAAAAGADVRRGATVKRVSPGARPTVTFEQEGAARDVAARLVVGADGRSSGARRWGGFEARCDEPCSMIAGLLFDGLRSPEDSALIYLNPGLSQGAYLFPQGGGRVRAYLIYSAAAGSRLQGDRDVPRFLEEAARAGAPPALFARARPAGPLASFEAADSWVDHPYRDGVALVGDAAATNDPSWGQGLSMGLRDARALRDRLLATDDWGAACHDYAREHDRYYGIIHRVSVAYNDLFLRAGPAADARRRRALPAIARDPARAPDHLFSGPDLPWDEGALRAFFGEDLAET
jgi:2-polyprenyl-6-methoxyphenol hydroxylase-like FAD-dependent oxidoreductase